MIRMLLVIFVFFSCNVVAAALNDSGDEQDYIVGVGDELTVKVYRSEDMETVTRVSKNGDITFPLLGSVNVAGKTTMEVEKTIRDALIQKKLLVSPQVNVTVTDYLSKTYAILGYVNEPGNYPIKKLTKLTDAIAKAGGYTDLASDVVTVTSENKGKRIKSEYNIKKLLNNPLDEVNPIIQNGDIIQVPKHAVFYIYGQVNNPGEYKLEANIRVSQALAKGGGVTLRGTTRSIVIERTSANGELTKIDGELDVLLAPNDVVYVKESWF